MPETSGYNAAGISYPCVMDMLLRLLRLMLVAAFAAGIGLPIQAATPPQQPAAHAEHIHPTQTPMDEACRAHCLGLSLIAAQIVPPLPVEVVVLLQYRLQNKTATSLWPQPHGPPPRI